MLWFNFVKLTEIPMLTLLLYAGLFVIGVAVGAYSHKWLAKVTGAPANITPSVAGVKAATTQVAEAVAKKV